MIIIDFCNAIWNRILVKPKKVNKLIESKDLISKDAIKKFQNLTNEMMVLLHTVEKLKETQNKLLENELTGNTIK